VALAGGGRPDELLVIVRHRENIKRLLQGTESTVLKAKSSSTESKPS
jgi:hypothetical protein